MRGVNTNPIDVTLCTVGMIKLLLFFVKGMSSPILHANPSKTHISTFLKIIYLNKSKLVKALFGD